MYGARYVGRKISETDYVAKGTIIDKINDKEYIVETNNGECFSFYSTSRYKMNTRVVIFFSNGLTDSVEDDEILLVVVVRTERHSVLFY